jgi:nicotinamidase-related amidase
MSGPSCSYPEPRWSCCQPRTWGAQVAHELGHEYFATEHDRATQAGDRRRLRELELMCDAIGMVMLHDLGMDPSRLMRSVEKLTTYNRRVFQTAVDESGYPTLDERRKFAAAVRRWIAKGKAGASRAVPPRQLQELTAVRPRHRHRRRTLHRFLRRPDPVHDFRPLQNLLRRCQRADAVREAGGCVAWVLSRMNAMPRHFGAILGDELATRYFTDGQRDGPGTKLWSGLQRDAADVIAVKSGASAFFPGKCNLKEQLDARLVDTILIAGAVTNICCESSARDAAELEYRVIMISDALSGHAHGLHEATLATFYRIFGDVRPSEEVIRLVRPPLSTRSRNQ